MTDREQCAHDNEIMQYTGDGAEVAFCPDCGRNRLTGYHRPDEALSPSGDVERVDYSELLERLETEQVLQYDSLRKTFAMRNPDGREAAAAIRALLADRQAAINEGLEMAAKACEAERLSEPQDETDAAYDSAIDHCIDAIRAMKAEK